MHVRTTLRAGLCWSSIASKLSNSRLNGRGRDQYDRALKLSWPISIGWHFASSIWLCCIALLFPPRGRCVLQVVNHLLYLKKVREASIQVSEVTAQLDENGSA